MTTVRRSRVIGALVMHFFVHALSRPVHWIVFVLAPAYYMPGFEALTPPAPKVPLCIVHGWGDDVVPVENSIRYAGECRATLHVVDGDHRLTANIDEICYLLARFIEVLS